MMVHMLVEVVGLGTVASLLLLWAVVVALLVLALLVEQIAVVRVSRLLLVYWMPTDWTVLTIGSVGSIVATWHASNQVVHRQCPK